MQTYKRRLIAEVFHSNWTKIAYLLLAVTLFQGCTAVNTFPTVAHKGDTVSVMVGGSELAHKDTIDVTLTDNNGVAWDLQTMGLVRSVFNLRADAKANGTHYSDWLNSEISWIKGHEPMQTVLVIDIPDDPAFAVGPAALRVNLNAADDSSGIFQPFIIAMEVIPGTGSSDTFMRQNFIGSVAVSFEDLEAAPYAKISFGDGSVPGGSQIIGAASLIVDFDDTIVNGDDLNVYVSESNVRGDGTVTGAFGDKQRSVFWNRVGDKLNIHIVAPYGIEGRYLQVYVVHPRGLSGDPSLSLVTSTGYDLNGSTTTVSPMFSYQP